MMIKKKELEAVVRRINNITNNPEASYTRTAKWSYRANVGNYHLEWSYGRVGLNQIVNTGGGVITVLTGGTKAVLYHEMHAFITGLNTRK
jgi:hypothetical protein